MPRLNKEKIEKIFLSSEYFDKKHKINQSKKHLDFNILELIEQGISIEKLIELSKDIPIFKYKTQITIHGIFPDFQNQDNYLRTYGYKYIFQNQNKSIGIKYNAIDIDKKHKIRNYARYGNFSSEYNSTKNYIFKTVILENEQDAIKKLAIFKKEYNNLDNFLFFGNKQLYIANIPFYGKFLVYRIDINAIYEKNVNKFIEQVTGKSIQEIEDLINEKKKQDDIKHEQWKQDFQKEQEQHNKEFLEKLEQTRKEYKSMLKCPEQGEYTCFYLRPYPYNDKQYIYVYFHKDKRIIEKKESYFNTIQPRKIKNKMKLEIFNKNCSKNIIFIESNNVPK